MAPEFAPAAAPNDSAGLRCKTGHLAPAAALAAARRCIAAAIRNPTAAADLLGSAVDLINAALLSVTPTTPAAARAAIQAEADELSTYIQCFE